MGKICFYTLYGVFGLLGISFISSGLTGHYVVEPLSQATSKVLLLLGAVAGGALLYRAYQVGELGGRYGIGTALVVAAVVAFQAIQVAGKLVGVLMSRSPDQF